MLWSVMGSHYFFLTGFKASCKNPFVLVVAPKLVVFAGVTPLKRDSIPTEFHTYFEVALRINHDLAKNHDESARSAIPLDIRLLERYLRSCPSISNGRGELYLVSAPYAA
jgi:hypothetical protein